MEADPGTFTEDTLKAYMSLGVNRFSIGIQAFQQVHSDLTSMRTVTANSLHRSKHNVISLHCLIEAGKTS